MGFELPIDVDYWEHPKTLMLIGLIGSTADVYPPRLWRWCALYARNGFVAGGAPQVESAVKWKGQSGRLHSAMVESGFIERDGKTVHGWREHAGRFILAYERKKQKQRDKYAAQNGIIPAENGIVPPNREEKGIEGKRREGNAAPPEFDESVFLAQEFTMLGGEPTSANAISRATASMRDLLNAGFTKDELMEEIHRKDRARSEHPGKMVSRMMPNGKRAQKPHDRSAALREAMKKEGHIQ